MNVQVINETSEKLREMELPDTVFATPYRRDMIHEAVVNYMANQRLGTHSTKTRAEVSGSGKKLWKQKGTGRARMGTIRSPLWYHGGITFGPKPRDYSYRVPKKVRHGAMRSLLSERIRRERLAVIETLTVDEPRTKHFVTKYGQLLDKYKTVLFIDEEVSDNTRRAGRNLPGVEMMRLGEVNIYDLARYEMVVFTESAILKLAEALKP